MLLGAVVFLLAFASSYYLTWRKARKAGLPVWDHTSKRLAWNMLVPLMAGGAFIIGMLRYDVWIFVAPACLVFYGLALVNASKYTLSDIRSGLLRNCARYGKYALPRLWTLVLGGRFWGAAHYIWRDHVE